MAATCYRQSQGGYVASFPGVQACTNSTSAAGYTPCCFTGSLCLENGLCYATTPASGTTGYYDALCSDPLFQDSSCSKHCFAYTKGDAIYDTTLNQWRCCGTTADGAANCQNPTNVTFAGPAPAVLLAQATGSTRSSSTTSSALSTTTGSSTVSSAGSTTSAAGNATSTPTSTPNSGLSTGAKAGIGVGAAAVVIIILLSLLFWFLFSKRRQSRQSQGRTSEQQPEKHYGFSHGQYAEKYGRHTAELSPAPEYVATEMPSNNYEDHKPYTHQHANRVHELAS